MNNRIIGFFTAALTLTLLVTSCSNPEEKKETAGAASKQMAAAPALPNEHLMTVVEAVSLIKNYLETINNSTIASELKSLPIGGAFSAEALLRMTEEDPEANGYIFYGFSDNEPATLFKDVKMLAACKFNYDVDQPANFATTDNADIYLINDTLKHAYDLLTPEAITNYLSQYRKTIPTAASVYKY